MRPADVALASQQASGVLTNNASISYRYIHSGPFVSAGEPSGTLYGRPNPRWLDTAKHPSGIEHTDTHCPPVINHDGQQCA
jgi:hypothetical protein